MFNGNDSNKIKDIIFDNNLYPNNVIAYVELFSYGSSFFWNKNLSKVEFINDFNSEINNFLESIRNFNEFVNNYENSLYSKYERKPNSFDDILKSNFYQRLNRTYIMKRNYIDLIKVTDSLNTLYYCECSLNNEIFDNLSNIQGKYLIIDTNNLEQFKRENNNIIFSDNFCFLLNYKIENNKEFLF